ncbi:MAG: WYL domain-containing protein [Planctomycetes bacterium]|nr:WYL domain-containing protein [Planctomycetota bacterium]
MRAPELYRGTDGDYLNRWKRILHLDTRLRGGGWPSATALARECGVSAKTIYRDLDALRVELGAPIEYHARRKGFGYSDPGFAIPAAALSERDLFALMVAENAVAQYQGTPLAAELHRVFQKFLALLPGEVRERHELAARAVHFGGLPPTAIAPSTWTELTLAIQARERIELDYFVPSKRAVERKDVEPYLLVVRDREWFLVARTLASRHFALFYVPRIKRLRRSGARFEPDPQFSPQAYYEHGFNAMHGTGKPLEIVLRFAPEHAHIADERPWSPHQTLVRRRDGSVLLKFRSNALFEIERQVLRFGGAVQVERPAELRRSVREASERMARAHR